MKLSRKTRGQMFIDYQPLCYKLAAQFARKYPIPATELINEAQSALGVCLAEWNKNEGEGKPITWIYFQIYHRMLDFCQRKQPKHKTFTTLGMEEKPMMLPAPESWLGGLLRTIGEDARTIVDIITMAPAEIIDELSPNAPKRSKRAVQKYLLEEKQWEPERVRRAWFELECAI